MRPFATKAARLALVGAAALVLSTRQAPASERGVGFLVEEAAAQPLGPEARSAWRLARKLGSATIVMVTSDGRFVGEDGRELSIDRFSVLWYHQGDSIDDTGPAHHGAALRAIRDCVKAGRGLFLSGAALAMVHTLDLESVRPRRGAGGRDRYLASLIPARAKHPIFRGLAAGGGPVGGAVAITDQGYPAFADFFGSGGPVRGMLLARAPSGPENPLAEYELGRGRVVVMGWRLPHYSNPENAHRANLERLTRNILFYLADSAAWQEVVAAGGRAGPKAGRRVPDGAWKALEMAVVDLTATFKERYPRGREYLGRLRRLAERRKELLGEERRGGKHGASELEGIDEEFERLRDAALLDNPLLRFDRLLLIARGARNLGLPANWDGNSGLRATGYDNRLCVLSPVRPDGELTTLYRPEGERFVGDVDLHFDADRLLFSMPGPDGRWRVFEMEIRGSAPRELPLVNEPDVDNFDACYLPNGAVVFASTAPFAGVPCVYGSAHVANLYLLATDGTIRQLTADQDHNWCPTVLNDGEVMYLRWEYSDLPHSNSRILFHMKPDGTAQREYYGSNSFFMNSFFYARPIPGHASKVVGIATGHHGVARSGRLLILDPARGRHEASGVVQEIPGRGQRVEPLIRDNLVDGVWPQYLHPYPLSEKYFLVSAKPDPHSLWGIYLVDVFDNMILLKEVAGYALFEPIPVQTRRVPPAIEGRIDRERKDALVYLADVYLGGGLKGIPRGTVKELRLFTYHYSYRGMGGLLGAIGMDGPWDIKRVLGTVPVERDGSALFRVPANTPISVQPLDGEGKALQIMRSWFTAMPGEVLSCAGCHERQNTAVPNRSTIAARRAPSDIAPWRGPVRGFSFARELQPVLDRYCVGCHNDRPPDGAGTICDLRGTERITDWVSNIAGHVNPAVGGSFSGSYVELHRYVRRPGIESDIHLLTPMEFHADSTELVQMLQKGHYNVELDGEAWDRLITWIDLNAPYHGTWTEIAGEAHVKRRAARRRALQILYAGLNENPEAIPALARENVRPQLPPALPASPCELPSDASCAGWPFGPDEARRRRADAGETFRSIELGDGVAVELVRIPAGEFLMGDSSGHPDEQPPSCVEVKKAFWLGRYEVTNEQFLLFDPSHDSHVEPMHGYQFGIHGYPVNGPLQPVVRVSWHEALAFCNWLSERTGRRFGLPTEAQWEYACRAGTATPASYGDLDSDFSPFANLGDAKLRELALDTYVTVRALEDPNRYDDWVPKDDRFRDGALVSADVGGYRPNAWDLYDMHGNVWEWTRSLLRPYPYRDDDGRNDVASAGRRVVRGGSWYDRPKRSRSAFRLAFRPYQPVFNVGFRVIMEDDEL